MPQFPLSSEDIGSIIVALFGIFIAIVLIAVLAPVVAQIGGGWYEAAFILMGFLLVIGTLLALIRNR